MPDQVWAWLFGKGVLFYGPVLTFLFLLMWGYSSLWRNKIDRSRVIARLEGEGFAQAYRRTLITVLNGFDARLSGPENAHGMGPGRVAFSSGLLQRLMLLAVVYPILMLMGQQVVH